VATERACSRGAEAQQQKGPREGHVGCVCTYVGVGVVSWTGGASGCPRGATKGASAPCLHNYARAATELRIGLDGALTVASAQPAGQAE
jgi:hypothetical protein